MIFKNNINKKNSKIIKYSILALFLALQSTDLLHDHHDHDHDEGHYCVACHAPNVDHDVVIKSSNFFIDYVVIVAITLTAKCIRKNKINFHQLPRSPPLT